MAEKAYEIQDPVDLGVPQYLHVLTGHYLAQGYTTRSQGTSDWLLTATLSGRGSFGSGPGQFVAERRDLVLIRPWTKHDYGVLSEADGWELLWAHFHPRAHWHDWLTWPGDTPGVMRLSIAGDSAWREVLACFRRAHNCATSVNCEQGQDLAMNSLERLLLRCQSVANPNEVLLDERVRAVLKIINADLALEMDVASMASSVSLSPSRFAHLFRQQVGVSPMHYLDLQRLQRAKQLLERTAKSISQIAREVGFDPIHFSLRFKQHTGLSPRAYRNGGHTH